MTTAQPWAMVARYEVARGARGGVLSRVRGTTTMPIGRCRGARAMLYCISTTMKMRRGWQTQLPYPTLPRTMCDTPAGEGKSRDGVTD